jgi:exodeoxyribonuclease V alpha subunit
MIFLQNYGVSPVFAQRIFKKFGEKSIEIVRTNPYCLSTEIEGIGFLKADNIAQQMSFDTEHPMRIESGLVYTLNQMARNGHSCFPQKSLMKEAAYLLSCGNELIEKAIHRLAATDIIISKVLYEDTEPITYIWLKINYQHEKIIAEEIARLKLYEDVIDASKWENDIEVSAQKKGITLAAQQERAVEQSLKEKLHIITGGPGTGKSTITKVVLDICLKYSKSVVLAAPTGRAAKRMTEITLKEASTIHALLVYDFVSGYFRKNKKDPLTCEVLIIDEASMIDAFLMAALLAAVPDNCKLILVGDTDQLPSVGAGDVLKDLIRSKQVPVTRLTEIFRQAINSQIIINAHKINQGIFPTIQVEKESDFFFINEGQHTRLIQHIIGLIDKRLTKAYKFHKFKDIQLLCPMNKGPIGCIEFNKIIQQKLNPHKITEETGVGHRKFVLADKVIQTRNNYDKGVYNGDIGYIKKIDPIDKLLWVDFDNKLVEYEFSNLTELDLAYAVSIHKYQGSESPCIIMPIHESYHRLLFRNLVYTGITRGKQLVILVGTKTALNQAILNNEAQQRHTGLTAMFLSRNELPEIKLVPMLGTDEYNNWVHQNFELNE